MTLRIFITFLIGFVFWAWGYWLHKTEAKRANILYSEHSLSRPLKVRNGFYSKRGLSFQVVAFYFWSSFLYQFKIIEYEIWLKYVNPGFFAILVLLLIFVNLKRFR